MRAIKAARKFIENNPEDAEAKVLAALVMALATETPFGLAELYALKPDNFKMAMDILHDWRLDRFYMGKAKLFDLSYQIGQTKASS